MPQGMIIKDSSGREIMNTVTDKSTTVLSGNQTSNSIDILMDSTGRLRLRYPDIVTDVEMEFNYHNFIKDDAVEDITGHSQAKVVFSPSDVDALGYINTPSALDYQNSITETGLTPASKDYRTLSTDLFDLYENLDPYSLIPLAGVVPKPEMFTYGTPFLLAEDPLNPSGTPKTFTNVYDWLVNGRRLKRDDIDAFADTYFARGDHLDYPQGTLYDGLSQDGYFDYVLFDFGPPILNRDPSGVFLLCSAVPTANAFYDRYTGRSNERITLSSGRYVQSNLSVLEQTTIDSAPTNGDNWASLTRPYSETTKTLVAKEEGWTGRLDGGAGRAWILQYWSFLNITSAFESSTTTDLGNLNVLNGSSKQAWLIYPTESFQDEYDALPTTTYVRPLGRFFTGSPVVGEIATIGNFYNTREYVTGVINNVQYAKNFQLGPNLGAISVATEAEADYVLVGVTTPDEGYPSFSTSTGNFRVHFGKDPYELPPGSDLEIVPGGVVDDGMAINRVVDTTHIGYFTDFLVLGDLS